MPQGALQLILLSAEASASRVVRPLANADTTSTVLCPEEDGLATNLRSPSMAHLNSCFAAQQAVRTTFLPPSEVQHFQMEATGQQMSHGPPTVGQSPVPASGCAAILPSRRTNNIPMKFSTIAPAKQKNPVPR